MLTGLVVGKFCPLHRGHERLIAFAAARCDRLAILSYTNPDFGYPAALRAGWLAAMFPDAIRLVLDNSVLADFAARTGTAVRHLPHNDAPDEVHREFTAWACHVMLGLTIDRVFTSEAYGDGLAASLAGYFRARTKLAHKVDHISYDPDRRLTPVSGTILRRDPDGRDAFLSDTVRSSLIKRVGIIGGESSGKTTLARMLAEETGTQWVPEYGRELWERRGGDLAFDDLLAIALEQVAREEAALATADRWLFCDTTPLVTAFYSEAMFGRVDARLGALARRHYDQLMICAPDFPFVQDGTRRDAAFRECQHEWYLRELASTNTSYVIVEGPVDHRRNHAARFLGAMIK